MPGSARLPGVIVYLCLLQWPHNVCHICLPVVLSGPPLLFPPGSFVVCLSLVSMSGNLSTRQCAGRTNATPPSHRCRCYATPHNAGSVECPTVQVVRCHAHQRLGPPLSGNRARLACSTTSHRSPPASGWGGGGFATKPPPSGHLGVTGSGRQCLAYQFGCTTSSDRPTTWWHHIQSNRHVGMSVLPPFQLSYPGSRGGPALDVRAWLGQSNHQSL